MNAFCMSLCSAFILVWAAAPLTSFRALFILFISSIICFLSLLGMVSVCEIYYRESYEYHAAKGCVIHEVSHIQF